MEVWDKMNKEHAPTMEDMETYVRNPLWAELCNFIIKTYQTKPTFEYSGCVWPGWNVKFKKAGKNLCTLYPHEGYFWVLVVIGQKEKLRFEEELPLMSDYLKELYEETPEGMGQRWLKIELEDEERMEDVKRCIAIRRGKESTNHKGI